MADSPARSPSLASDGGDDHISDASEVEESPTVEAGPSTSAKGKGKSSGKGKGRGGGQQGRARATVVCRECKRLKLRCNREQPCNQCGPKGKADKCVYSKEASQKLDGPNLNIRIKAIETYLTHLSAGVPVGQFVSNYQPVVESAKKEIEEYESSGGQLRPGTFLANLASTSISAYGEGARAKGSLLSDLHELVHHYTHLILDSEGLSPDDFCACNHDATTPGTEGAAKVVKEEEGREVLDVNMNPDTVSERQPRSFPKPSLVLPPLSHFPDGMSSLPSPEVYYPEAPTFYPTVPGARRAHWQSGTTNTPTATPSATTNPPLPLPGDSSTAPRASLALKPSVTPALIKRLPTLERCMEMLARAQKILAESPVELGLRSRTAPLPQELRDKFPEEMTKAFGWGALTKRVKMCLSLGKEKPPRSTTRQRTVPPASSSTAAPANTQARRNPRRAQPMAGSSHVGDMSPQDHNARSPSVDPRTVGQNERSAAPPPPPSHESLPFFTVICALLAFGADPAKDQETNSNESAPFLLALCQQALGLWVEGGEYVPPDKLGEATDEVVLGARADYLRACSLSILFYLNKTRPSVPTSRRDGLSLGAYRHPNQRQVVHIMGKMATQVMAWDYEDGLVPVRDAEDPHDEDTAEDAKLIPRIAIAEGEQARLRLFWQVLYFDTCIAGMFQREPFIPASRYLTGALPVLVPDYREMVAEVFRSPDAQDVHMSSAVEASRPAPAGELKPEAKERREMDEERLRTERLFLVSRARITRLSSVVDRHLAKGGYSLEHAAELAGEVEALSADLPEEFRFAWQHAVEGTSTELLASGETVQSVSAISPSTPTVVLSAKAKGKSRAVEGDSASKASRLTLDQDGEGQLTGLSQEADASKLRTRTLSCELALMTQLLVVRIYTPFASKKAPTLSETLSSTIPEPLLNASKAIIRVAKLIHRPGQTYPGPSTFLAMCSPDQLVLDATLMCTQHCFGGTIIESKDSKAGAQKKDAGSGELMQTIGIGLDLLDVACSISKNAEQVPLASSSSQDVVVTNPSSLETRVVASLRKQWSFKNSSFAPSRSRKRTRSTMEGNTAGTSIEPVERASPRQEPQTSSPRNATDQQSEQPAPRSHARHATERQSLPSTTPADTRLRVASPVPVEQPSSTTQPPTSAPTPVPPPDPPTAPGPPKARLLPEEVSKPKGKPRTGDAAHAQITIRSRGPGGAPQTSKRKQEPKSRAPSRPLLTTAERAVGEDGKMRYVGEDRVPTPQSATLPRPQHHAMLVQPSPAQPPQTILPPQSYHSYGSASATPASTQMAYNVPMANLGPANRYPHAFDGTTIGDTSVPPSPHPEYGGYASFSPPAPAQSSSHQQQHHTSYSSHPQSAMTSPVQAGMGPGGYFDNQRPGSSSYPPSYGHSAGPDVYMKHGASPSSYSTLSYAPDPGTASGSSMSNWQDPQTAQGHAQEPPSQHHYSTWQSHGYQQ